MAVLTKARKFFAQQQAIRAASLKANLLLEGPMAISDEKRLAHRHEVAAAAAAVLSMAARRAGIASAGFEVRAAMDGWAGVEKQEGSTYVGRLEIDLQKRVAMASMPGKPDTKYPIEYVAKALRDMCRNMRRLA